MKTTKGKALCIRIRGKKDAINREAMLRDAINWEDMLRKNGIDVELLVDKEATIQKLDSFFKEIVAKTEKATANYLFYSGPSLRIGEP